MNIRWLWLDYVPNGVILSKEQRRLVSRRTWEQVRRPLPLLLAMLLGGLMLVVLPFNAHIVVTGLLGALVPLSCFAIVGWVFARPAVFRAVREAGVSICANCGYDLRGQVERRCPECRWEPGDEGIG